MTATVVEAVMGMRMPTRTRIPTQIRIPTRTQIAIRLLKYEEVNRIIAMHLDFNKEASSFVREAAVAAAAVREPVDPVRGALIDAATNDPHKQVKRKTLQVLKEWSKKDETLIPIIEKVVADIAL